jgi:hypothetical protein
MMSNTLIVPTEMLDPLRSGIHIELGNATQAISDATDRRDRQGHPEWFTDLFGRLDAIRALLRVAGWSTPEPARDIEVDLDTHRGELLAALTSQLCVERNLKDELDREHAERAARCAATKRVLALSRLVAQLKARLTES